MSGFARNEWCPLRVRKWGMMPRIHFLPARVGGGVVIVTRASSMTAKVVERSRQIGTILQCLQVRHKYRYEPQITPCDSCSSSIATFSCEIQPTLGFCRPCLFSSLPFIHCEAVTKWHSAHPSCPPLLRESQCVARGCRIVEGITNGPTIGRNPLV